VFIEASLPGAERRKITFRALSASQEAQLDRTGGIALLGHMRTECTPWRS